MHQANSSSPEDNPSWSIFRLTITTEWLILLHRMSRKIATPQLALPFRTRGGARPGAGPPRLANRPSAPHRPRPKHSKHHPVHITLRGRPGVPSFRTQVLARIILKAIHESNGDAFGIVH